MHARMKYAYTCLHLYMQYRCASKIDIRQIIENLISGEYSRGIQMK